MNGFYRILFAKGGRVFVFGLASVMTPVYVATLGFSPFYVGIVLGAIIAGNVFSNILLTWLGKRIGFRKLILSFALLMLASGLILYSSAYFGLILLACFLGNISTSGTEAGPFQSIETGILPNFVAGKTGRAFGTYNVIGYAASALGALAASLPAYFGNSIASFHSLYLIYGLVGLLLFFLYSGLDFTTTPRKTSAEALEEISGRRQVKKDITILSILFGTDAFGGGFVSQSLLSYWFFLVYGVSLERLGIIFFFVGLVTAGSILVAPFAAERLGNLRTMVSTHVLSNLFLVAIPLVGSLIPALGFLFLRQSVSQMDVPTRQTFMVEIFETSEERISANAVTNTSRSIATLFGGPISGALLAAGLVSIPILTGGLSKLAYDAAIFVSYRKRTK